MSRSGSTLRPRTRSSRRLISTRTPLDLKTSRSRTSISTLLNGGITIHRLLLLLYVKRTFREKARVRSAALGKEQWKAGIVLEDMFVKLRNSKLGLDTQVEASKADSFAGVVGNPNMSFSRVGLVWDGDFIVRISYVMCAGWVSFLHLWKRYERCGECSSGSKYCTNGDGHGLSFRGISTWMCSTVLIYACYDRGALVDDTE